MLICFLTCLCLYLYVLVLFVMLCLDIGVQFLLAMFMLKSTCWLLCLVLLQPFISCYAFFLCFGPQVGCRSRSYGLGLHPYGLGLHQRVWIISFMHVFACLLLCFRSMFVWLDLGSRYALCPPWACACWSLGPLARVVASVPLVAHQDVTTCKNTSS